MPSPPASNFLAISDWDRQALIDTLDLAARLKKDPPADRPLARKTLAMIFAKSSTRTRVSFEVGAYQLGMHALFLSSRDIQLGRGEPIRDTARVLSRYVDAIMIRTFAQEDVEELAEWSEVPVINGLTDLLHPCQVMADLQTVRENLGEDLAGVTVAWVGDGNNMANSWLNAAAAFGFHLRLAFPKGYAPDAEILDRARSATAVVTTDDPREAVTGADVVTTDVWTSMGQEEEAAEREQAFRGYCIDRGMMETASERAIFLHCLPAHRGEEVTEEVVEGSWSRVWDEAENRLHAQKAILLRLLAPDAHGG
ncbi:MAG: ornithine carbamoyltransferase [Longimicrobiaceae bacterium]